MRPLTLAFVLTTFTWPLLGQVQTMPGVLTPTELFEKVSPYVVTIVAKDEDGRPIGTGSGFIISATIDPQSNNDYRRWVVTNHHVVRAAVNANIDPPFVVPDAEKYNQIRYDQQQDGFRDVAHVLLEDERADLAVLAAMGWDEPGLSLADDALPKVGTSVFVISSPEGLKNTLCEGLVSGYREFESGERWIQITAPISHGSSGGPVLTAEGKVIGVVVASRSQGQNLNFAVPVGILRRLLDRPLVRRPLWKGTSWAKERQYTFTSAVLDFKLEHIQAAVDMGADKSAPSHEESYKKFVSTRAAEEDQLALLIRGVGEFDEQGSSTKAAIADLTEATKARPGKYDYLAHYYLGHAYYWSWPLCGSGPQGLEKRKHFLAQSFEPLRKAIRIHPEFSPSHHLLALGYKESERYPDALVAATNLIALVPRCSEAYQIRGQIFADLENRQGFEDDFKVAFELRPNNAEAFANMAFGYSALKDWDAAIEANKKALAAADNQSDSWRGCIWGNLANAYVRKDDCRSATPAFEKFRALTGYSHPFEEKCRQPVRD